MAGLYGLRILLLWAGIISLTNTSSPPQCSYTVATIKFGFQIDITSSNHGDYTINLKEQDQLGERIPVQHSSQTSSHQIKHLKPCTEYEHDVTYLDGAGEEKTCSHVGDKTRTTDISREDIRQDISCSPGHVCYRSDWDLTSLQSTPDKSPDVRCDDKTFCVKPSYDDICSDFTTKFISGNCRKFFTLTTSIPVDFVKEVEITPTAPTKLPAKIETTLPPKCKVLSIDYTCWESGKDHEHKKESELEPFTDYSCTGQIKDDNDNTIKTTTAVHVRIDCDFTVNYTKIVATNTSFDLSWNTTSQKCQQVLHDLQNLSYACSCGFTSSYPNHMTTAAQTSGATCQITGLEPFSSYTCEVQPIYNKRASTPARVTETTGIGIPKDITHLMAYPTKSNVIVVRCHHSRHFNGPEGLYIARLAYMKEIKAKSCPFKFTDLNYSTNYRVQVTAFNGHFESMPLTIHVATLEDGGQALAGNNTVVLIIIINIIAAINITSATLVYKIYLLMHRKMSDVIYLTTAVYIAVPKSARRNLRHPIGQQPDGPASQIIN